MRNALNVTGAALLVVLAGGCSNDDDGGAAAQMTGSMPPGTEAPPVDDASGDEGADPAAPATGGTAEGVPDNLPLDDEGDMAAGDEPVEPLEPVQPGSPVQETIAPLLSVRQEHAVVALGSEIVVIGGFTPSATNSVEAYDPEADTWRPLAAFPSILHHANAVSIDGTIIVAGFYLGGSFTDARGNTYAYDPASDAWTERAPLPAGTERASSCVAALDGKMYVFGGARNGSVRDASVYDPASDTWTALPQLPEAREHCAAGAIDGQIIIAGGRADGIGGFQPNTWSFDPVAQTYEIRAPLLTARGGVSGAVLDGRLILFGGEGNASDPTGVFPQVEAYDPEADTWEALPSMVSPRHGLGAAALDGAIYLPGGASTQGFGAEDTNTVFRLAQ
jgi:N-acetylneuraminic acid mutarotase